jgi:hypothetical protein
MSNPPGEENDDQQPSTSRQQPSDLQRTVTQAPLSDTEYHQLTNEIGGNFAAENR